MPLPSLLTLTAAPLTHAASSTLPGVLPGTLPGAVLVVAQATDPGAAPAPGPGLVDLLIGPLGLTVGAVLLIGAMWRAFTTGKVRFGDDVDRQLTKAEERTKEWQTAWQTSEAARYVEHEARVEAERTATASLETARLAVELLEDIKGQLPRDRDAPRDPSRGSS